MVNDSSGTVIYRKDDGIAYISLNRPTALNAYNTEMRDELYQVLHAVRDDAEVGVAVLRGEGRAFCSGADLTEFGTAPSLTTAREVRWERDVWGSFLSISKPIIASIHGFCLGSGVEIALLCDLRVAADDAVFGVPELSLGLIPAAGGTQTLPRLLGVPKALELLLTRKRIRAAEALESGLISKVVPKESLDSEVEAMARRLVLLDQGALRALKDAVWRGIELPLDEALALEAHLALRAMKPGACKIRALGACPIDPLSAGLAKQ